MNRNNDPPLQIRNVFIKGNKRTRATVFEDELQDAYKAECFSDVRDEVAKAAMGLSGLGIFDSVDIKMDKAVDGGKNETDLIITVKEKNWTKFHIGANTDGHETSAESSCTLTNPLGSGEIFVASASHGTAGSDVNRAHFQKPRFLGLPLNFNANAANETLVYEKFSSYREKYRGGTLSISDYAGVHEIALNLGWRDVVPRRNEKIPSAFAASQSIISEASPSMKTSIKYMYNDDQRNSPVAPTKGKLVQYSTEVAGAFGDVQFVKAEGVVQKHIPIGPEIFAPDLPLFGLSLCGRLGAIKTYGNDSKRTARISDRFFVGGPLSLRGFHHKGIGPRATPDEGGVSSGDSLGGEIVSSASASFAFPLPFPVLSVLGFRGHMFANAGNLMNWKTLTEGIDATDTLKVLASNTRASVGVGIVYGSRFGRLEANYSWILKAHESDNIKRGQIGLGMTFF